MKRLNTFYLLFITASLIGCGGGGGGGSKAIQDESAEGIWTGFSINSQGVSSNIVSVFYAGQYVTLNTADKILYSGSYTVTVDSINSQNSKSYLWDGLNTGNGSMDGTVYSKSTIQSRYTESGEADTASLKENSEIVVYETSLSDKNLNKNMLKGSWKTSDSDNKLLYAFVINGSNFSAEASDGCLVKGEINIPRGNLNIFELTLEVSGSVCAFNGDYSGLGFLGAQFITKDDGSKEEIDVLTFAYSNNDYGFVFEAVEFVPLIN